MGNIIIEVENVSKLYRLGELGTGTLSHDLNRWWARLRGKEDPYAKLGSVNDRAAKADSEYAWALQDINFKVAQGEVLGLIGRNGAGKSTLLKVLSRVTQPTRGQIRVKGRIASLLEVGTGFHPELTGRENIFLNGAIMGMTRAEIRRKFDEIVDFAGVSRYVDTPVKRYSSGMYVRLAFAVAAYLEPEILIVDEVLAVGDAEFQKKALGKMKNVSEQQGRTVLFVSHNLGAIEALCHKGVLLDKGTVRFAGDIHQTIMSYLTMNKVAENQSYRGDGVIRRAELQVDGEVIKYNSSLRVKVMFESDHHIKNLVLGIVIKDIYDTPMIAVNNKHYSNDRINAQETMKGTVVVDFPNLSLLPGEYKIDLFLGDGTIDIDVAENAVYFSVEESSFARTVNQLDYRLNKVFINEIKWNYKPE